MSAEEEILVLAPLWRDAQITCRVLAAAGLACRACSNMHELHERLAQGAGAVLITQDALGVENRALLLQALQQQPAWSDLSVTLLLAPSNNPKQISFEVRDFLQDRNVTLLRRPVPTATLITVMQAALRARSRQYELREHLRQREERAELLEQRVRARTARLEELSERYLAARNLFFTLFQANPLPIAIVGLAEGIFIDANNAFLQNFGLQREQVVGQGVSELRDWLPVDMQHKILGGLRRNGVVHNLEATATLPSGETRTALISAEIVSVEGQEAVLVALVDITERKRAEEQIRALALQLNRAEQEERHRISQLLHDDLQQQLYSLQMQLSFVRDDASESIGQEIDDMERVVQKAIETVRSLSVDLSPPILHDEGLVEALGWIATRMQELYRLQVDVEAEGSFPVADDGQRVLLLQIVRELLFNAVKHAGVRRVKVSLQRQDGEYRIDVVDEGTGFDPKEVLHENSRAVGGGLNNARQRLRLIGGRLKVESAPEQGTRVTIYAPVIQPSRQADGPAGD